MGIRVVLADDHPVVRAGIKTMLEKEHAEAEALQEDRRHDLARRIERLDAQIDTLVCELYGLVEEEVKIVEGK